MKDKRVYTPPTLSTEILTVGVFGAYGSGSCGRNPKRRRWFWWWTH